MDRRGGSTRGLTFCTGLCKCPETKDGNCLGHVSLRFIQECNAKCLCPPNCPNRVVQNGVTTELQVTTSHQAKVALCMHSTFSEALMPLECRVWQVFFVNKHKGWGIRMLQYLLPGRFLFEYAGEVVTNAELLRRGDRAKFSLSLTADWQSEADEDDNSLVCIDSTVVTNVARWLNYRYKLLLIPCALLITTFVCYSTLTVVYGSHVHAGAVTPI